MPDRPPPDPSKLLEHWMEWEKGEMPSSRLIANLKTGGMRSCSRRWPKRSGKPGRNQPPAETRLTPAA